MAQKNIITAHKKKKEKGFAVVTNNIGDFTLIKNKKETPTGGQMLKKKCCVICAWCKKLVQWLAKKRISMYTHTPQHSKVTKKRAT